MVFKIYSVSRVRIFIEKCIQKRASCPCHARGVGWNETLFTLSGDAYRTTAFPGKGRSYACSNIAQLKRRIMKYYKSYFYLLIIISKLSN